MIHEVVYKYCLSLIEKHNLKTVHSFIAEGIYFILSTKSGHSIFCLDGHPTYYEVYKGFDFNEHRPLKEQKLDYADPDLLKLLETILLKHEKEHS